MSHALRGTSIFNSRTLTLAIAFGGSLLLGGCAGGVVHWIVATRVAQGNTALANGNLAEAELSYNLALRVDPRDHTARAGFVNVAGDYAQSMFAKGHFADALTIITEGLKIDPASVRLAALKRSIERAKLQREIVISNYPTYKDAGVQIRHAYAELVPANKNILAHLLRFSYTYDADQLTTAIKQSYELQIDVAKNTNRLIVYRQEVQSGIPESAHAITSTGAASLLPLP